MKAIAKKYLLKNLHRKKLTYTFTGDVEQAIKEADGLIANDVDQNDGKWLKESTEAMVKSFKDFKKIFG